MPRANRYIQPGHIYHLTHRCHNRKFLLRCRIDRTEYCTRLRHAVRKHRISLFDFCVTCNHVHLLLMCKRLNDISRFMQQLEGEFAAYYNKRKNRSGAFWGERFHCTMIECGDHLWNCLRYIDLNMVRARAVYHPSQWSWCGYREIMGQRQRFRILDTQLLLEMLQINDIRSLAEIHKQRIDEAINAARLTREAIWTESIAVGSENFVKKIASQNMRRKRFHIASDSDGTWYVKEYPSEYEITIEAKKDSKK